MTDKTKPSDELHEDELDSITGGVSLGDLKPRLTEAQGIRAGNKAGIRAKEGSGIRAKGSKIRATRDIISSDAGKG